MILAALLLASAPVAAPARDGFWCSYERSNRQSHIMVTRVLDPAGQLVETAKLWSLDPATEGGAGLSGSFARGSPASAQVVTIGFSLGISTSDYPDGLRIILGKGTGVRAPARNIGHGHPTASFNWQQLKRSAGSRGRLSLRLVDSAGTLLAEDLFDLKRIDKALDSIAQGLEETAALARDYERLCGPPILIVPA